MKLKFFLLNLFNFFLNQKINYCILGDVNSLPNINKKKDIDILIDEKHITIILRYLIKNFKVTAVNMRQYCCSVFLADIHQKKRDSIMLDFIFHNGFKGLKIIDNNNIFINSINYKNKLIKIPSKEHRVIILFIKNFINNNNLQQKDFDKLFKIRKNLNIRNAYFVSNFFSKNFTTHILEQFESKKIKDIKFRIFILKFWIILISLIKNPFNFQNIIKYYILELKNRFTSYTLKNVCFLGTDGSGKTFILSKVKNKIGDRFYNCNSFHLRPFLLKKNKNVKVTNPHDTNSWPFIIAMIKLSYWIFIYHFKNNFHGNREMTLNLWDRYIHDILIDPRRYKLKENEKIYKFFIKLAPNPTHIFVIKTNPRLSYKRKGELSVKIIKKLQNKYLKLINNYNNVTIINNSNNFKKTTNIILKKITQIFCLNIKKKFLHEKD